MAIGPSALKPKTGMPEKLWDRLLQMFCRHDFSWPHTGAHGRDYQTCLACGAAYEYDWTTMRRTRRLMTPVAGRSESLPEPFLGAARRPSPPTV